MTRRDDFSRLPNRRKGRVALVGRRRSSRRVARPRPHRRPRPEVGRPPGAPPEGRACALDGCRGGTRRSRRAARLRRAPRQRLPLRGRPHTGRLPAVATGCCRGRGVEPARERWPLLARSGWHQRLKRGDPRPHPDGQTHDDDRMLIAQSIAEQLAVLTQTRPSPPTATNRLEPRRRPAASDHAIGTRRDRAAPG